MIGPTGILTIFGLLSLALILLLVIKPAVTRTISGKVLAFIALFLLPVMAGAMGVSDHIERSQTTGFCLSCHIMNDYGKSLHVDDKNVLVAAHFQNSRVPRDRACFTCHTNYTMYGDYKAKLRGMRHVYVQYLGTIPNKIELYTPYNNRECLHCHEGARSFEE